MLNHSNHYQQYRTVAILASFHIFIISLSNYLVQIAFEIHLPLTDFSFNTTWGTFTFPFIFLATDLTVRVANAKTARRIIFWAMFPALVISYLISVLFYETQWQGIAQLSEFNLFVFRIALASFLAYLTGQLMDIFVFNQLRQKATWWIAPSVSILFGCLIDTFIFFFVAFYHSDDPFMATNWLEIGTVDYLFKVWVSLMLFVPLYGLLLNYLIKTLNLKQLN